MTTADYSKAALTRFLGVVVDQGLMNANTAAGLSASVRTILEDIPDTEDVRSVDVGTAIKRHHNKHPGELKPSVLMEYQRRLKRALSDFVQYTENPTSYKGRGRGPNTDTGKSSGGRTRPANVLPKPTTPQEASPAGGTTTPQLPITAPAKFGMTVDFNMRPDFLAQVVVPRDMKAVEARRLSRFIMALAMDYEPREGEL